MSELGNKLDGSISNDGSINPESLRKIADESAARDRLHMKTHLRLVSLERALIEKGLVSVEDIEAQFPIVMQELAKQLVDSFDLQSENAKKTEND